MRRLVSFGMLLMMAAWLSACVAAPQPVMTETAPPAEAEPSVALERPHFSQTGIASWYGAQWHNKRTASGEPFDMNDLTAAHRSLPIGTIARVTNLANGATILVRINDRGPFASGRVIDVSRKAAKLLAMQDDGLVPVRIEVFASDQNKGTVPAALLSQYSPAS